MDARGRGSERSSWLASRDAERRATPKPAPPSPTPRPCTHHAPILRLPGAQGAHLNRSAAGRPIWAGRTRRVPRRRDHRLRLVRVRCQQRRQYRVRVRRSVGRARATVELCYALGSAFGVDLPASLVYDHPSAEALAEWLAGKVCRADEGAAPTPLPAPPLRLESRPQQNLDDDAQPRGRLSRCRAARVWVRRRARVAVEHRGQRAVLAARVRWVEALRMDSLPCFMPVAALDATAGNPGRAVVGTGHTHTHAIVRTSIICTSPTLRHSQSVPSETRLDRPPGGPT